METRRRVSCNSWHTRPWCIPRSWVGRSTRPWPWQTCSYCQQWGSKWSPWWDVEPWRGRPPGPQSRGKSSCYLRMDPILWILLAARRFSLNHRLTGHDARGSVSTQIVRLPTTSHAVQNRVIFSKLSVSLIMRAKYRPCVLSCT
jgi:hypothetical protein